MKNDNHYKIYKRDENKNKVTIEEFDAANDQIAIDRVQTLRTEQKDDNIFWCHSNCYVSGDFKDGKFDESTALRADSMEELFKLTSENKFKKLKKLPIFKRIGKTCYYKLIEPVCDYFSIKYSRFVDFCYTVKWAYQRVKYHYDDTVTWNIGPNIIESLLIHMPKFIDNLHGYPHEYTERASKELNVTVPEGDYSSDNSRNVDTKAFEMWKADLTKFLEDLALYHYYTEYGIIDESVPYLKEIDKKYKSTLKYIDGTEDLIDYKTLFNMAQEHYDNAMKFMVKWLPALWD